MPHVLAQDLRNAVLQAALQGGLTNRLSTDSDINNYYDLITSERLQLINKKELKPEKCLSEVTIEEPFDIPENWKWCYLGECIQLTSGADLTPDKYNDKGSGTVYITGASNIENGKVIINRWTEHPRSMAYKGDMLLTCKGTIGTTCFLNIERAHIARQIMAIRPIGVEIKYVYIFIQYYVNQLKAMAKSIIPGIERKNVLTAAFPLPPIEEQARIVARVDELMAKIDEYEKIEKELVELHKTFPGNMKDAILQAAMQGKLVDNICENDGFDNHKISKEEYDYDLPEGWGLSYLEDVTNLYTGNSIPESVKKAKYMKVKEGYNYIGTKDVSFDAVINYDNGVKIPFDEGKFKVAKKNATLLCIEGGSAGKKIGIISEDVCFGNKLCSFNPIKDFNPLYLNYFLQSPMFKKVFYDSLSGMIGGVSVNKLKEMVIPCPCKKEQEMIVGKLNSLIPLCESLEKEVA